MAITFVFVFFYTWTHTNPPRWPWLEFFLSLKLLHNSAWTRTLSFAEQYFVLFKTGELKIYASQAKYEGGSSSDLKLALKEAVVDDEPDSNKRSFCYSVTCYGRTYVFVFIILITYCIVQTNWLCLFVMVSVVMSADSEAERKEWMSAISKTIQAQYWTRVLALF